MAADDVNLDTNRPSWGIVDIGSNSVRLVVYGGPAAAPLVVLNEKALCGLGERDLKTGNMRPEAIEAALKVLARYKAILNAIKPMKIVAFATAASRDAGNGAAFLNAVRALGLDPVLLSGNEEARLAALGILSSAPEILNRPGGAVGGDIGGGSLELCHISGNYDGYLGQKISLPLGALRLASQFTDDIAGAQRFIDAELDSVDWLENCPATALFVVGGAWRALARISMRQRDYPLEMLDHYTMLRRDVAQVCDVVCSAKLIDLEEMQAVQRRRAVTLPFAAMVLRAVFDRLYGERVVVSSCGVREGVIFDRLDPADQAEDPLPVLAGYVAKSSGNTLVPDVATVSKFLKPIFAEDFIRHRRLWNAAITLSQASQTHHPEMRAEQAAQITMGLPLRGVTHRERAMLATSLFYRHGGSSSDLYRVVPVSLLDNTHRMEAKRVGLALRFALELDPNGQGVLPRAHLSLHDDEIRLSLPINGRSLWGRGPEKRFERLAGSLGKKAVFQE